MSAPVKTISEKDKRFVLALVGSAITVTNIVIAAVAGWVGNWTLMNQAVDTLKYTFTLTTMAWTWYFGKQDQTTTKPQV